MAYYWKWKWSRPVVSDSLRPRGLQPTRLLHPWDSPGKNTGVGCHFLLQCLKVNSESEVAQSCPTPHDPMDCSPPGPMGFPRQEYWSRLLFPSLTRTLNYIPYVQETKVKTEHVNWWHGKHKKEQSQISRNKCYHAWKTDLIELIADYTLEKKKLVNLKIEQ